MAWACAVLQACGGGSGGGADNAVVPTAQEPGLPGAVGAYYIAPGGSDTADCKSAATACKTFATVFARMGAGGELVLLDGSYTPAVTGVIHWDTAQYTANSAQIPAGSAAQASYVHALNPGQVRIEGPLFVGRSSRKDSYITLRGLRFEGGGALYNTSHVTVKDCAFHGSFGIGTNDHHNGNSYNLVEDVWVWAAGQRIIASNYRAHNNVWRRVVVRGDGCGTSACAGSGNPNVGFTVYDSHDVSVQNMVIVDRVLAAGDYPGADFATAQHTPDPQYYFGRNEWLGIMSLHAPDIGYYNFPDQNATLDPTSKVVNAVVWNATSDAFDLDREGSNNELRNLTGMSRTSDVVRVGPALAAKGGTLRNVLALGGSNARYGINSAYAPAYANVFGSFSQGAYNQTTCSTGCYTLDARAGANPALRYLTRIEAGSALKAAGEGGADIGANIVFRYGADGSRYGEPGYNSLGSTPLWPWPNEARIKADMCADTTRGFCTPGTRLDGIRPVTLTSYVWETLGNPMPSLLGPGL